MNRFAATSRTPWVLLRVVTFAALISLPPVVASAQDASKIYDLSEVDVMPKLGSSTFMAKIINDAFPANLRRAGIGGAVQMEFVVDEKGKVDISSVDAISNNPSLTEAAKQVAPKLEFSPAKVKGTAVQSRVVLPPGFKP